jgi:hypothetical protein
LYTYIRGLFSSNAVDTIPYEGATETNWIGLQYNVTDPAGYFTEADGSRSRVIHQFDRYGRQYAQQWLPKQSFARDYDYQSTALQPSIETTAQVESTVAVVDPAQEQHRRTVEVTTRRTETDTGVDVSDPALYDSIDLQGDSSTATVMGMASGYDLDVYQRFVGSLRKSGYKGHIILGVAPNVNPNVLEYFSYRNVTAKVQKWVDCTYKDDSKKNDIFNRTTCAGPYPDIKIRWSRFPLARDWLQECATCTGPVLVMDVRDSLFQLDPFGPGSSVVTGLQVFQEHPSQTTKHWLTHWPILGCKGVEYDLPMLCSGTTVGTRAAMLKYLDIMYAEMQVWISDPKCRFEIDGDDQSIHNYLFYSGQLPFATSIPNRAGGIVNTVGVEGAKIFNAHKKAMQEQGREDGTCTSSLKVFNYVDFPTH